MTKKFKNFSRCTCDHSKGSEKVDEVSKCGRHNKKTSKSFNLSGASLNSSGSSSSDSNSSLSSSEYSTSSNSDSDESTSSKLSLKSQGSKRKQKSRDKPEEFEDIKSMEKHRKQNHPECLHKDLLFNEPDQVIHCRKKTF